MLRQVALVKTDVSVERIASLIRSVQRLLITATFPRSPIFVIRIMEAIRSTETSTLKRVTLRHTPEDSILDSHRRKKLRSYIVLTGWAQ
jgi:hypothetical protein